MDGAIRAGGWPRVVGTQLTGKTVGLIGVGGIGAEMARLCAGIGMKVLAWNRSAKAMPGVEFVELDRLLAESDVVSLHLLLNDETRGFLSRERLAKMKPGAILVNTARGAIVDELALAAALEAGHLGHAGLDVFIEEPLPAGHPLTRDARLPRRLPHAGGERQPDWGCARPLPADSGGGEVGLTARGSSRRPDRQGSRRSGRSSCRLPRHRRDRWIGSWWCHRTGPASIRPRSSRRNRGS
jgi:hypothetical protein